uniref:Uncharacterized protein n=1 Tax=Kalanchoe fedtschenkoi TaxID=63787 RepID=A0A7N0V1Y2_KALFE
MTRWHRAATDLRHALNRRSLLLLRPSPISPSLYSTSTSSPSKRPRKTKAAQPPPPQQSLKSWVNFNAASAQMDKIMLEQQDDEMKVAELDVGRWPKPSEIPWQAKVANCVNLIGHIKMPVQFRSDDGGTKSWACSMIRQETSSKSNPLWMPVLFEGDLAHVVACHVKENDYVYVVGHLSAKPSPFSPSTRTQPLQVIVESINFVDESSRLKKYFSHTKLKDEPKKIDELSEDDGAAIDDKAFVKQSWRDVLLKPHEWWDVRSDKEKSAAAFRRKDNGELLFIDESTPQWLLRKLDCLTFDKPVTETKQQTASGKTKDAALGPWKDLLDDTEHWRDYRKDKLDGKVSAKHPDFKRKDRSISLWLSSAPKSILSELENLEFGGPGLSPRQLKGSKGEESWKDLVENPHKWWDNRLKKRSEKAPDFSHKDTGEGLWLNTAPKSILSGLENVDFGAPTPTPTPLKAKNVKGEELWKDVVDNPLKWWDNRLKKLSEKSPDFKHKETGEALWLINAPTWVLSELPPSKTNPSFKRT